MPPKKQKTIPLKKQQKISTASSSRSTKKDYDKALFASAHAEKRFDTNFSDRTFVEDRYYAPNPRDLIYSDFEWHQLEGFTATPKHRIPVMIQQFYANFADTDEDEDSYYCRSAWVTINEQVIQKFYKLPDVPNCAFEAYLDHQDTIPWEEVETVIAQHGRAQLTNNVYLVDQLNKPARYWMQFIAFNVLTTSHLSDMSREHAILTYCFMTRKPINIPRLIISNFKAVARSKRESLAYPHMFTEILQQGGSLVYKNDAQVRPKGAFKYESMKDVNRQPRQAPATVPPPPQQPPQEPIAQDAPPQAEFEGWVRESFTHLEGWMRESHTRLEDRVITMQDNLQMLIDYVMPNQPHPPPRAPPSSVIVLPLDPTSQDTSGPSDS